MYRFNPDWMDRAVKVYVVGVGGSGSHVAADLAVLHQALLDLGHPEGIEMTLIDADNVSAANVGRARYFSCDVGMSKAHVMAQRLNMCHGQNVRAVHGAVGDGDVSLNDADVVFGCVDTRASRRAIHKELTNPSGYRHREKVWIDLGNGSADGQVVLGVVGRTSHSGPRPPTVVELFPEMLDPSLDPVDSGPSCSREEAIASQGIFVNKTAALHAVNMLTTLFRKGCITYSGLFFDTNTGCSQTIGCTPDVWARFGYGEAQTVSSGQ